MSKELELQKEIEQTQGELKVNLAKNLGEVTGKMEEAVTKMAGLADQLAQAQAATELRLKTIEESEAQKSLEASEKTLRAQFASASPEEQTALRDELVKEFGASAVGIVFDADNVEKILHRPLTGNETNYLDLKDYRETRDAIMIRAAMMKEGATLLDEKDGTTLFAKRGLKSAIEQLAKANLPMFDEVVKGINDSMDTAETGLGLEMVPTQILSRDINDGVWNALRVANQFPELTMTGPTFSLHVKTARTRAYRMAQATAVADLFLNKATAHPYETSLVTWNAEKLAALIPWSDELADDSVLPTVQEARSEIIYGLAEAIDDACLNGSTSLVDYDNAGADGSRLWNNTGDPGAADARNSWDGIRKLVGSANNIDGATWTEDVVNTAQQYMDKYAVNPDDLVLFVSIREYLSSLNWDSVKTRDLYGDNMTLLRGELARVWGIPIVPTSHCYTNLASTGLYTGAGQTKGVAVLAHRQGFAMGNRKGITIETGRNPLAGMNYVLAHKRCDFQKRFAAAEKVAAVIDNI